MIKKILLGAAGVVLCVGVAFAATKIGKVTGNAYDYSDEGTRTCCPKIRYPNGASVELTKACKAIGGSYYKDPRFVESAYCSARPVTGKGWKYQCSRLVEADCIK